MLQLALTASNAFQHFAFSLGFFVRLHANNNRGRAPTLCDDNRLPTLADATEKVGCPLAKIADWDDLGDFGHAMYLQMYV